MDKSTATARLARLRTVGRALALAVLALVVGACERPPEALHYSGHTMGTTYNVTVVPEEGREQAPDLHQGIRDWLASVDHSMSTYRSDSELSRLNEAPTGEWLEISPMILEVLTAAKAVGEDSGGAFDITIGPLVDLWGFGPEEREAEAPDAEELKRVRERTGLQHLRLRYDPPAMYKARPIQLDLSALAKGFAADLVGRRLKDRGFEDYLVEIGGDLLVSGHNPEGGAWRVGIERPSLQRSGVQQSLALEAGGVASSGGYRNFFRENGQKYSHILDPRVGRPIRNQVVSVTTVESSAMLADAWATAYSVMGAEAALALAERRGSAVYLLQVSDLQDRDGSRDNGGLKAHQSEAFADYVERESR